MKYKLEKPNLHVEEVVKLNFYANYIGYNFKYDKNKGSALFEQIELDGSIKDIAYIQRDQCGELFVVWRSNECQQHISKLIDICIKLNTHNVLPIDLNKFNMAIGINSFVNHKLSKSALKMIMRYDKE